MKQKQKVTVRSAADTFAPILCSKMKDSPNPARVDLNLCFRPDLDFICSREPEKDMKTNQHKSVTK